LRPPSVLATTLPGSNRSCRYACSSMAHDLEAAPRAAVAAFGDRLAEAVEQKRSQLLVGLDPVRDLLPVELAGDAHLGRAQAADAYERFCRGVIDAVAPYAVGVKPQVAFFEALGADGMRAFEHVCAYARMAGLLVVADAKRGDIGSTSRAYAAAYLEPAAWPIVRDGGPVDGVGASPDVPSAGNLTPPLADAMTVSPYLGRDSLEPLLAACRRDGAGIFCLVKTSNEGVAEIQDLELSDGRPFWQHVARLVGDWGEDLVGERGLSSVGAVVGATHPRAVAEARRLLPRAVLLLPGVGAQGASPGDLARAFTSGPASAVVAASRSVLYAFRAADGDWRSAAAAEAARLRGEIWAASGW
jgi:orotidine-5'-phosphate decarboxylase